MKKYIFFIAVLLCCMAACSSMDDNYKDYLEDIPVYSPRVDSLTAEVPELHVVTLNWKNPANDLAKKINIQVESEEIDITIDQLVDTYTFRDLPLKGIEFSVFTIDARGNRSIPVVLNVTPIPVVDDGW